MNKLWLWAARLLAAGAVVFGLYVFNSNAPGHSDPTSAVGDGPGPFAPLVCGMLNQDPSVHGVRLAMKRVMGPFAWGPQGQWDAVLNAVVWDCPEHAQLLRDYANFYGRAG